MNLNALDAPPSRPASMYSPSLIGQFRDMPLGPILGHFGLTPRQEGATTRYKNDQFNIVVSHTNLWFDNAASIGGRGAIDLTLHLHCRTNPRSASDADLRVAITWLASFQPDTSPAATMPLALKATLLKESFASQTARLAIRDDARWPLVRDYLLRSRRLPGDLVGQLYESKDIYASFSRTRPEMTCVCFVHRNLEGQPRGATIRATTPGPGFAFSIGEKAAAWFTIGNPRHATRAIVVEAPIDAISYAAMKRTDGAVVAAMSCAHVFPSVLQAAHERRWPLTVAFDNDPAGNAGWERCEETQRLLYPNDPPAQRIMPTAKDWNEDLCATPRRSHGRHL
jgi:hypothetical protein